MNIKIINNIQNDNNHYSRIEELLSESDEMILTSPFLMTDFASFFKITNIFGLARLHVITTLVPKSVEQIKKITSLNSLINIPYIKNREIECKISINNRLHGKIYIFKKNGDYTTAIVSSANFTDSGLHKKHEWGIEISDRTAIMQLNDSILDSIEYSDISFADIAKMETKKNEFLQTLPKIEPQNLELDLSELISTQLKYEIDTNINYWLKPMGVSKFPIQEKTKFDDAEEDLHFSSNSKVKLNDILIAYGVGAKRILSVFKAITLPEKVSDDELYDEEYYERWPWYITGENLTPKFGGEWWSHNLYLSNLVKDYLSINENNIITAVGGKTSGALQFGHDKIQLSPDFAKYIIDTINLSIL